MRECSPPVCLHGRRCSQPRPRTDWDSTTTDAVPRDGAPVPSTDWSKEESRASLVKVSVAIAAPLACGVKVTLNERL
jgi:hypothetical protein